MQLEDLIQDSPPGIADLFLQICRGILSVEPDLLTEMDTSARLAAFELVPGLKGTVFTVIPAKDHITIGFYKGSCLEDPHHLLAGTGKVHRHIKITDPHQISDPAYTNLLHAAVRSARNRISGSEQKES